MAAKSKSKRAPKSKSKLNGGVARQSQAEFPPAGGAKPGKCRVCGVDTGAKATLCATHRALLARKRDRALFLAIKATDVGKDLIDKAIKKGALSHLGF